MVSVCAVHNCSAVWWKVVEGGRGKGACGRCFKSGVVPDTMSGGLVQCLCYTLLLELYHSRLVEGAGLWRGMAGHVTAPLAHDMLPDIRLCWNIPDTRVDVVCAAAGSRWQTSY
jgi:hypothetical protein